MKQKTDTRTNKRPYRKPQLEQVRLVLEEAVLQGCKVAGGTGPATPGADCLNKPGNPCNQILS